MKKRILTLALALVLAFSILPAQTVFAGSGTGRGFNYLASFLIQNGVEASEGPKDRSYSWSRQLNSDGTAELDLFFWKSGIDYDMDYIVASYGYVDELSGKEISATMDISRFFYTGYYITGFYGERKPDNGLMWDVYYSSSIYACDYTIDGEGVRDETYDGPEEDEEENKRKAYAGMYALLDFLNDLLAEGGCTVKNDLNFDKYSGHGSNHTFLTTSITAQPTCTAAGQGNYKCLYCGKTQSMAIPALGHDFTAWIVVREADCEPGLKKRICMRCGEEETQGIPGLGHIWDEGVTVSEVSCTQDGVTIYTCSRCETTKEEVTPALGHAWSFTEILNEEDSPHACTGLYTCTRCNETKEARLCAAEVFTDMPAEGNWAHDPIDWAYFNGITAGKSPTTFNPKDTVTRAEAMTFLWKTLGSPEPGTTENPFADVKEGKYYYKPVLWAVENGITSGTSETTFGPKDPCTRAQILTFIWTAAGRPEPETTENPFTDVKEGKYYYKAVLWGVENQITSGIAPDQFGTNNTCTRAQIVAFLYLAKDLMPQAPDTP